MKINKKVISLSLVISQSILFADTSILEEIKIEENKEFKTNSINIDLEKVEQSQANSLTEVFKNNSSIEVGGGAINVQRIYLRGIESSNLNISLDGAKQGKNMFQHRSNELGINPDLLKVVDVNTSPDASKAGALGGSIEMSTKDAQDFVRSNKKYGAIFKTGYNTNAYMKHGNATAYQVFDNNLGAYISISGVNSDNYKDANKNSETATAYHDRDYLFKISLLDSNNHDLRLTVNKNENSGDSRWAGTEYRPQANQLEKIISTTTNYALSHNYNPNNLLNLDTLYIGAQEETVLKIESETLNSYPLKLKLNKNFYNNYQQIKITLPRITQTGILYLEFDKQEAFSILNRDGYEIIPKHISNTVKFPVNNDSRSFSIRLLENTDREVIVKALYFTEQIYNTTTVYESTIMSVEEDLSLLSVQTCDNYTDKNVNIKYEISVNEREYEEFRPNGKLKENLTQSIIKASILNYENTIKLSNPILDNGVYKFYTNELINSEIKVKAFSWKFKEDFNSVESFVQDSHNHTSELFYNMFFVVKEDIKVYVFREYMIKPLELQLDSSYVLRDYQDKYDKKIREDGVFKFVELQAGRGKSLIAMKAIITMNQVCGILIIPKYIDKWIIDIKRYTNVKDSEIYVVQGGDSLSELLTTPNHPYKFIIFSLRTTMNCIKDYEESDIVNLIWWFLSPVFLHFQPEMPDQFWHFHPPAFSR